MESIVWQPKCLYQNSSNFKILLNSNFAKDMLESKLEDEVRYGLNKIAEELLNKRGFISNEPIIFYGDSLLVEKLDFGENSSSLILETNLNLESFLFNRKKPLEYFSEKVNSVEQREALMSVFDLWTDYSLVSRY